MTQKSGFSRVTLCLAAALVLAAGGRSDPARYLSPETVVADSTGRLLYVAAFTAGQILVYDTEREAIRATITVPDGPSGLALSPDGLRLYVTGGVTAGKVYVVDTARGAVAGTLPAGHTPNAPVVSPDSRTLYVANRFNHDISIFDLPSKRELARVAVLREPVALRLSADGRLLFVGPTFPFRLLRISRPAAERTVPPTPAQLHA